MESHLLSPSASSKSNANENNGSAPSRVATIARKTKETEIRIRLDLDGSGQYSVSTGIPFFDHMLESFGRHGLFDLEVEAKGDIEVDLHHTARPEELRGSREERVGVRERTVVRVLRPSRPLFMLLR